MKLLPYLTFNGNCGEAFDFYKSVFGGDFAWRGLWAEAPREMKVAEADKNKIMHISLPVGDSELAGVDAIGIGEQKGKFKAGNNFSIAIAPDSKAEADKVFSRLSEGGQVTMEMQDTFWDAYYGMCTDKFGVQWMVNYAKE